MGDNPITLQQLQAYIRAKDHDPGRKEAYFLKLIEETGELAEVIRKNSRYDGTGSIRGTIEEELYDVLYYVVALANLYDIDLETCCRMKETINQQRYGFKNVL